MPQIEDTLFCDGCGAEISGAPVVQSKQYYCCERCAEGQPCDCALYIEDERHEDMDQAGGN
jgi:hypothetical protein